MKIENSLDYQIVRKELIQQLSSIRFNPDLGKMLYNIDGMVSELSKIEVGVRRSPSPSVSRKFTSKLAEVNSAMHYLSQLILIANVFPKLPKNLYNKLSRTITQKSDFTRIIRLRFAVRRLTTYVRPGVVNLSI